MPNPVYAYILDTYDLVGLSWLGFYGIPNIGDYLTLNNYAIDINDL